MHGYLLRSQDPAMQLIEVVRLYDLSRKTYQRLSAEYPFSEFAMDALIEIMMIFSLIQLNVSLFGRFRILKFRNKGYLYPVPGKPGQFRSATTHSTRIHGDDPFREVDTKH